MTDEHKHDISAPYSIYGPAVTEVYEKGEELWIGNGEYSTQVDYCPVCGYEAKERVLEVDDDGV